VIAIKESISPFNFFKNQTQKKPKKTGKPWGFPEDMNPGPAASFKKQAPGQNCYSLSSL
jgi:hypothetical protein